MLHRRPLVVLGWKIHWRRRIKKAAVLHLRPHGPREEKAAKEKDAASAPLLLRAAVSKKPATTTAAAAKNDAAEDDKVSKLVEARENIQEKAKLLLIVHQKWLDEYSLVMQNLREAELKLKEALQECNEKKSSS